VWLLVGAILPVYLTYKRREMTFEPSDKRDSWEFHATTFILILAVSVEAAACSGLLEGDEV